MSEGGLLRVLDKQLELESRETEEEEAGFPSSKYLRGIQKWGGGGTSSPV